LSTGTAYGVKVKEEDSEEDFGNWSVPALNLSAEVEYCTGDFKSSIKFKNLFSPLGHFFLKHWLFFEVPVYQHHFILIQTVSTCQICTPFAPADL
jgi:hypothetical protein